MIGVAATSALDGESPRAYIVRRSGTDPAQLTEQDVVEFAARPLVRYKRLTAGVRFVQAIPKNASGKILKRILRDQAKLENVGTAAKI